MVAMVAEIIGGELRLWPRPATPATAAASALEDAHDVAWTSCTK
jgi:hypothetical protein